MWRTPGEAKPPTPEKLQERKDADERTQTLVVALLTTATEAERPWRELLSHLLEFHRREAKPAWWAMFARQEMADHDLLDDAECLAMLSTDPTRLPRDEKKSKIYAFTFPAQDFKLRLGDKPLRAGSGEPAGEIVFVDDSSRRVELKLGPSRTRIEDGAALIPEGPVGGSTTRARSNRSRPPTFWSSVPTTCRWTCCAPCCRRELAWERLTSSKAKRGLWS